MNRVPLLAAVLCAAALGSACGTNDPGRNALGPASPGANGPGPNGPTANGPTANGPGPHSAGPNGAGPDSAAGPLVLPFGQRPFAGSGPRGLMAADSRGLTAATALGDPRTLDTCLLTAPDRMTGEFTGRPAALDECELDAGAPGGAQVRVLVGPLVVDDTQVTGRELGHGLRASPSSPVGERCEQWLEFADRIDLRIAAQVTGGDPASACTFAGDAVTIAADRAVAGLAGPAAHPALDPASYSVFDPCSLAVPSVLAAANLVPQNALGAYPQRHRCTWYLAHTDPALPGDPDVTVTVGPEQLAVNAQTGSAEQIAAHPGYVLARSGGTQPGDTTDCLVQTAEVAGDGSAQVVTLTVAADDRGEPGSAVCAAATTVATLLWPHLPAANR